MINLLKKIGIHKSHTKQPSEKINSQITKELKEICSEIERTNIWFQAETDENLIDASIHQREALNARYRYLISKLKPCENSPITEENPIQ